MKWAFYILALMLLTGCGNDEISWISIKNGMDTPIFAQPYSSEYADANWIQPGVKDEFYSINCDCLDGFTYFSFYYDSLIIIMKDMEDKPIKFYKDGTTVNYDATKNPFTNPDVWKTEEFDRTLKGDNFNSILQAKHISEHYFSIHSEFVKSLADTVALELNPSF